MSEQGHDLAKAETKVPDRPINKAQFKNQGMIKAAARGIVLEALTAFKGGKVGKRGLLVRAMDELAKAFDSDNPLTRQWAVENVLKMANGMAKDDKAGQSLTDLLQGGANVQISFNSYFDQRSVSSQANPAQSDASLSAGQGLTIGFTPPPGSGARPPSA